MDTYRPVALGSSPTRLKYCTLLGILTGVLENMGFALKAELLLFMGCVPLTVNITLLRLFMGKVDLGTAIVSALRED